MIELGPESYLGRKTIMTELAKDIGLEQDIVTNTTGQSYILRKINYIRFQVVQLWVFQQILNHLLLQN